MDKILECLLEAAKPYRNVTAKGSCGWVASDMARDLTASLYAGTLPDGIKTLGYEGGLCIRRSGKQIMIAGTPPEPAETVPVHGPFRVFSKVGEVVMLESGKHGSANDILTGVPHTVVYIGVHAPFFTGVLIVDANTAQFVDVSDADLYVPCAKADAIERALVKAVVNEYDY